MSFDTFFADLAARLEEARAASEASDLPEDWEGWLRAMFPEKLGKPFADHHREFWEWAWAIGEERARPFVGIWPRRGGKTSNVETMVAALGARGKRRYVVYVSEQQDQANDRVGNIAGLLESESINRHFPLLGARAVNKYGASKGWRRNRLQTASGFIVDALGLDANRRGLNREQARPDLIVFDDIDGRHDTKKTIAKKRSIITDTILPMGSDNTAVVAIQNLIIPDGIFGQMVSGEADFLADRIVSGPIPAIRNLETHRWEPGEVIPLEIRSRAAWTLPSEPNELGRAIQIPVGGEPTWEGQGFQDCFEIIKSSGFYGFRREQQHEVEANEGALWKTEMIRRVGAAPSNLRRVVVGVDPSGGSAEIGIVVVALGADDLIYVVGDKTQPGGLGPANWGRACVDAYNEFKADRIVAERNFGGDMVESTIRVAANGRPIKIELPSASRGKEIRAEPIVAAYEDGRVRHVGVFRDLEDEMLRWVPGIGASPNRLDALVWAMNDLLVPTRVISSGASARPPGI